MYQQYTPGVGGSTLPPFNEQLPGFLMSPSLISLCSFPPTRKDTRADRLSRRCGSGHRVCVTDVSNTLPDLPSGTLPRPVVQISYRKKYLRHLHSVYQRTSSPLFVQRVVVSKFNPRSRSAPKVHLTSNLSVDRCWLQQRNLTSSL